MTVQFVRESNSRSHFYVTLSARNLLHLQRMLNNGAGDSLVRQDGPNVLHINVEPDSVHYANREAGPGYVSEEPPNQ